MTMSPEKGSQGARTQSDVWHELFGTVDFLSEAVELSIQALSPDNATEKVVSATTKKRLHVKSLQSLRLSRDNIQVLQEHLKALQAASQQWQKTMMFASKSHEELMEQLESTNRDLHLTTERLRSVEAQHLVAVRETEAQRQHILNIESAHRALQAAIKQREDELETSHFAQEELRGKMAQLSYEASSSKDTQVAAEQERDRAVAALEGVRAEADKAQAATQRHQETVAKLTADNLVFVMSLKKTEADLAEALADKSLYKMAAEKQRGPWFDEVRASVEERVRHAMSRAETLEAEMEVIKKQHAQQLEDLTSQKSDLEEFLTKLRVQEEELTGRVASSGSARDEAEARAAAAGAARERAEQAMEELSMRNRVLQDNVKTMRQECTERWVSEQAAVGKVRGLEDGLTQLQQLSDQLKARCQQLEGQLEAQAGVNRQLMARKEHVEWQLMEALAKVPPNAIPQPPAAPPPAPIAASPARAPVDRPALPARSSTTPLPDTTMPVRLASDFYGSPPRPLAPHVALSPPRPVVAASAAPSPSRPTPLSPARPAGPAAPPPVASVAPPVRPPLASVVAPAPSPASAEGSASPMAAMTPAALPTFVPAPTPEPAPPAPTTAPATAPATSAPASRAPSAAQTDGALPSVAAPVPAAAPLLHPSSPPHYMAATGQTGVVAMAHAATHDGPSRPMPPKAMRTSAVLLEQQQPQPLQPQQQQQQQVSLFKGDSLMTADAFSIVHSNRPPAARQHAPLPASAHPVFFAQHPSQAPMAAAPPQVATAGTQSHGSQAAVTAVAAVTPQPDQGERELVTSASLSLGVAPAPAARPNQPSPSRPAQHSTGSAAHATSAASISSASPIARDPSQVSAAQGSLAAQAAAGVYHPAMHPALLVAPAPGGHGGARGQEELSFGGATGRRISASSISVTTTPPPKSRPQ